MDDEDKKKQEDQVIETQDDKLLAVEKDKKGRVTYSKEDVTDKYYVSPEEIKASLEADIPEYKSPEEFKSMSKEEKADYLRSGTNEGLNFVSQKSEKSFFSGIKEATLEKWFKKGKEKKTVETNYTEDKASPVLGEGIFTSTPRKEDHIKIGEDKREVNLRKSGIPKDNTHTTFRQMMEDGLSDRLNPRNEMYEKEHKKEYRSDGTLKKESNQTTNIAISRKQDTYTIESSSNELKLRKDGETPKKETSVSMRETADSKEESKTVTSYRKDGTVKKFKKLIESLTGRSKTVGKYDKNEELIDINTKNKDLSEKDADKAVEEHKSEGLSPVFNLFRKKKER